MSYTDRFPLVAGFVSQAQLVFGSRVIQTAEGTGRLTEVPWNHQGAHCSAGGSTGQLGGDGDRDRRLHNNDSQKTWNQSTLKSVETPLNTINKSWGLSTHVLGRFYPHATVSTKAFFFTKIMKAADEETRGNQLRQGTSPAV